MTSSGKLAQPRLRYHRNAYEFVFQALRHTQDSLGRDGQGVNEEENHVSGAELLEGVRELALKQFGLLTKTVFHHWGIHTTDDFGRIVFEMIERGEMKQTDRDRLSDFYDLYDFDEVFDRGYRIDTSHVFRRQQG